uniref:SCP domain-containing protein n=1 Tax=Timema shepardi TaxID=629360 RepID=A0A7R9FWB2_TIMSH|nr:unnamed protein product [Timema shepardi]
MKDWQEIVKLYEKDNVYLSEAAQMLIRNVNYEVPSIKKQIAKCEQFQQECDKKVADYGKAANSVRGEFQTTCKQLGIQGRRIKHELVERLVELPAIYSKMADNAKNLDSAAQFYSEFVKFVLGKEYPGGCIPLLKYLIKNGNTSTYQWVHKEPPLSIEEPPLNIKFDDEPEDDAAGDSETIDFGDDTGDSIDFGSLGDADAANIDFGDITLEGGGDIDWGGIEVVNPSAGDGAVTEEIDFNISLEETGIVVESSGLEGGVAKGQEALTILDNPSTRNTLFDEIKELESFLKIRLHEMRSSSSGDLLSMSLLQDAPSILQLQSIESVEKMLSDLQGALTDITDQRTQHLHNIKHSPKYVDLLANSLKQKLAAAEKLVASQEVVRQRRNEAHSEANELRPKLKLVIDKTKQLQAEVKEGSGNQINLCRDRGLNPGPPAQKSDTLPLDRQVALTFIWMLTNALVVLSSTAEDGEIEVRISVTEISAVSCLVAREGAAAACNTPTSRGFSQTEKDDIVNEHNRLRNIVALGEESRGNPGPQPSAANMRKMSWNEELAKIAQRWVDQCIGGHDACRNTDRYYVGQNSFTSMSSNGGSKFNKSSSVGVFFSEVTSFNNGGVDKFTFSSSTGHYTQLVWADTHLVGCGSISFPSGSWNKNQLVCNYGPGGNMVGASVYQEGKPCSKCPEGTKCDAKDTGLCA